MVQYVRQRGSALVLVLISLALITSSLIGLFAMMDYQIDKEVEESHRFRAYQLALTGISYGSHPDIEPDSPLLTQTFGPGETLKVEKKSENTRIPINTFLVGGKKETFTRLFELWGLDIQDAVTLVERLSDWVDIDDLKQLNGAERIDYVRIGRSGQPRNGAFTSLNEIRYVLGMETLDELKEGWLDSFTLWSDGTLDLSQSDAEPISAVLDVPLSTAEAFIQYRDGRDGINNTDDDVVFQSALQALSNLGLNGQKQNEALSLVSLEASQFRVTSIATVGSTTYRMEIIVNGSGENTGSSLIWIKP
ncbi:MAG: hypothetical protein AAF558_08185 [Verrucomicrobiota bacterium]